jgi:hypothetical protein
MLQLLFLSSMKRDGEEKCGGSNIIFGGEKQRFPALKVPRQCLLVLLIRMSWREGKHWKMDLLLDYKQRK